MKKKTVMMMLAAACMTTTGVRAQSAVTDEEQDSLRMESLQEIVVKGVRGHLNSPFATSMVRKKELKEFSKTGRELPMLLASTPGIMAWSENGLGTGTVYMRMRGSRDARINVTIDGVPLNSPEDQCVFWANMNSYGSLLGSVQVNRGVGTSTHGDGAFGGSIALSTATPLLDPSVEVSASYGSYNTVNVGANVSTGLLWDHLVLEGAYHATTTDGFIHGTDGTSGSYYGGATWMGDSFQIRYKNIGNFEKTGQAWNGVTAGDNDLSLMDGTYGAQTGIKDYKDLWNVGLGRYNTLYETLAYDAEGNFQKDAGGNYVTRRYELRDGKLWKRTTDNFWQNHNILSTVIDLSERWKMSASLHYTYGYGYYEEFRPQNKLSKYGLTFTDSEGNTLKRSDFVRKKGLTQHTYGLVANANYQDERWDIIGGVSVQNFDGYHFGKLTYIANEELEKTLLKDGPYRYYDSDAHKLDGSVFVKAALALDSHWTVFGDLQYRHVGYRTDGINDKFYEEGSRYYNQPLDIDKKYDFLNPKVGFSAEYGLHRFYGSVAMAHREPERNNFTDNGSFAAPTPEQLIDFELGYTLQADDYMAGLNAYYMSYKDQFVQTGQLSDIGEPLTTNIPKSYRMGVELQASYRLLSWLDISANGAFSTNKLKDFTEYVEDWDNGTTQIHYDKVTMAFAPAVIANGFLRAHYKGFQATWHTNYVSRQYLDNSANKDRSLRGFSLSSITASYTLPAIKSLALKEAVFSLSMNNIFNGRYAANGWVYSAICESYGHTNDNRYYQIGYVPMAGFTIQGGVTLKF